MCTYELLCHNWIHEKEFGCYFCERVMHNADDTTKLDKSSYLCCTFPCRQEQSSQEEQAAEDSGSGHETLVPEHLWRSSMARYPLRQSHAVLPVGWRWDEIDDEESIFQAARFSWPRDLSELADGCSESWRKYSFIDLAVF